VAVCVSSCFNCHVLPCTVPCPSPEKKGVDMISLLIKQKFKYKIRAVNAVCGLEKATVKDVAHRIIELIRKDEWLREQPLGRIMLAFLLLASGIVEVLKEEEKIDLSRDVLDIAKILFDSNRDPLADMMVA